MKIATDYRQDNDHWWGSRVLPDGGVTITLTTYHGDVKPGAMVVYFAASDVAAAHKEPRDMGVNVNDVQDDLFGPGSGVKWFGLDDPVGGESQLPTTRGKAAQPLHPPLAPPLEPLDHWLTAPGVTPRAAAMSSYFQPWRFSSQARRRPSRQSRSGVCVLIPPA